MSAPNPEYVVLTIQCPECGKSFQRKLKIPYAELQQRRVKCLKCGHEWTYRGTLRHRIRCPICGSSQNDVNRKTFGKYGGSDQK
jgi:predicted Zn finger-like uncharacterized protein